MSEAASYDNLNAQNHTDPRPDESAGFVTPAQRKKRTSNWIKFGIPVLIIVIVAAVVGGVVGSRKKHSSAATADSSSPSASAASASAAASSAASAKLALGRFATATESDYMMPIYPSTTDSAAFGSPTFVSSSNSQNSWPMDPFQPSNPDVLTVRQDRPRLIAPAYKWAALPTLIANDPYLQGWNATIFGNATAYYSEPPVIYFLDDSSGILDNARAIKERVKAFSYVYRMTNDTTWVNRLWEEIQNAAGNGTTDFGPDEDRWNSGHFLDTAELSAAYGIAYDWLYDVWSQDQKDMMLSTLLKYGLNPGVTQVTTSAGWWRVNTTGNWNCVCNSGLTIASLAILGDDTTGVAKQLLQTTVDNAIQNCAQAVSDDGTWAETANYWYFGTTGHAEMAASLLSATGSDYGLLKSNPNFVKTGDFHMYVTGATSLFNYGDHGPNKYSTTANSMIFYADFFNEPQYALFQRDQWDAADPWSMFWYDPTIAGAFWDGKPLDNFFDNGLDQWGSMRSTWTDTNALYVAMKAGMNLGHQNHNDLDCGDFVLDALGTRWAGELGSGDYNAPNYFVGETQTDPRWMYYRKMTEGQNTILINQANQNVNAAPTVQHGTSNTTQGPTTVLEVDTNSTAYFTADLSSAYFDATSMKRGVRLLNGRKQVLLQDEIDASESVMWRMHTNATVSIESGGTSATLTLDGQTMKVAMLNPPSGAAFTTSAAQRFPSDPTPPAPDQPNPGVTVLIISLPAGTYTLEVLFNPQWPGSVNYVTPPSVALDQWTLTSHDSS
ncbi:chondroitin AC/alginate lyase [Mycena maculata]|uniref:Chondroitin AC/alginate lyase n=1 Tax=Mycena maculata TaxID=230809 RepID=A0AAD7IUA4_9AGAR|nr:chondroitin AC/alginate lyase [Mycena maculata]